MVLPGGGDLSPGHYGGAQHETLYDMDTEQDAFDLAVARWCVESGRPLLAICRGMQVVNVAMGGTLVQDMPTHHRHVVSDLTLRPGTAVRDVLGQDRVKISCYHHQAVDRIGRGLRVTASSEDEVIEAVELSEPSEGWFLAVQWHPEDTAATDPAQQAIFAALVAAARTRVTARPRIPYRA